MFPNADQSVVAKVFSARQMPKTHVYEEKKINNTITETVRL